MRCKKHLADRSSSVGVCASCLRERLYILIEDRHKLDTHPPRLVFPRSVSPRIFRQKSDTTSVNHYSHNFYDQGFFGTPEVDVYKKQKSRFSPFSRLFRFKSSKPFSDSRASSSVQESRNSCVDSSPSRFCTLHSGHEGRQSRFFVKDQSIAGGRRRNIERGMSPARVSGYEYDAECRRGSSGYSSDSSQGWRQTPRKAVHPAWRCGDRPNPNPSRNVSGLRFCLSPLVRASPSRQWNQKGITPEIASADEARVLAKPHLSTASTFRANRSRKLTDYGRFNPNR